MSAARYLVIFAKAPRMGRVKTRLARGIGTVGAWAFYRRALESLVRRTDDPRWRTLLAVSPDRSVHDSVWPRGVPTLPQGGGDLGQRMQRTFDSLPPGPAVIVGADIPDIDRSLIARAFAALGDHDAVFGPADDGGYWLVGLKRRPSVPRLFKDVRWSTDKALADTLANTRGMRTAMLPTLIDVDDAAGLGRWRNAVSRK